MFKIGISFGRNDLNLEGHSQMGFSSRTIKNYNKPIDVQSAELQAVENEPHPSGEE